MEYKEFTKRYFDGELSSAEEQTLREGLMAAADEGLTADERAAKTLLRYASLQSDASVRIKLHDSSERRRSRITDAILSLGSLNFARVAMTTALGVLLIGVMIHFTRPTVYGYHNGRPITSYDEAQLLAQDIFDNLAHEGFAEEHNLQDLFTLD
jgi:hypothetical protein